MSRKVNDSYEYKEATMKRALEYASFGWLIGKNSEHYSTKEKETVVTLRRDFVIGANPTISDCEKDYLKLERGKIPTKYLDHVFLKFLGRCLVVILTILIGLVGIAGTAVGVYDGFTSHDRVKALYNSAAECGLVKGDPVLTDDDAEGTGLTNGYLKFVAENPTLNTFGELVEFAQGKVSDEELYNAYVKSLFYFGVISDTKDETVYAADPTAEMTEEGYGKDNGMFNVVFDPIRSLFCKINFDAMLPAGMPSYLNTVSLLGGAALLIFLIMAISTGATAKKRKIKRRKRCAVIMKDCVKQASEALYNIKNENRELMTKKDEELFGLENIFSRTMMRDTDDFD